jgi:hypothetical protein
MGGKRPGLWTPAEEQRLRDLWEMRAPGAEVLGAFPNRTPMAIRNKAYTFGMLFKDLKAQVGRKKQDKFMKARSRIEGDKPLVNDKPRLRKCLTCGFEFQSAGPQNRLCQIHRHGDGT